MDISKQTHKQNHIQAWLASVCNNIQGVAGCVVVQIKETGLEQVAQWPPHFAENKLLTDVSRSAIDTRVSGQISQMAPGNTSSAVTQGVSVLLTHNEQTIGAVTVGLSGSDTKQAQGVLTSLQREIGALDSILDLFVAPGTTVDAGAILQLQAAILSRQHFDEAAATFATLTAQLLGIERICVGFLENGQVTLVAISHGAALDAHQEINRNLAAAMEEAIDQSATLSFPHTASGHPRITLAHAELVQRNGGSLCTVPIVSLGAIVGAVTAERDSIDPFSAQQIALLEQVVALVGPLLALKGDSQRPWRKQVWEILRKIRARLTGPDEHQLKLMVGGSILAGIILLLVPMPYHVSAPARLEGAIQRALVAPADGFIQQVSVRPGDTVTEGQILAELATQDLLLEQRKWESELAQHENTYGAALAQNDRSQLMVNQAKVAESQAKLELVESQIERTRIKAPFNGIVISGDLSQSMGAPIQRGDVLMVIAPHDHYRLIVEVDERDVADVKPGASGRISLAALPGEALSFSTDRVVPVAVTRNGRHFFELEGKLDAHIPSLRPGLQGVAKIDADKRTLAWALSHHFLVWLRLSLWNWTG